MTEGKESIRPEELWECLSDTEKEACVYFAFNEWGPGVDKSYIEDMGIQDKDLEELQKRGVLESKPEWKINQELADSIKQAADEIQRHITEPDLKLTDRQRTTLQNYDRWTNIASRHDETPRYRLADQKFHDYVFENHQDYEVNSQ